jgi:hypothetical protein
MDMELRRRGVHTAGVKGAVTAGWTRHLSAEKLYSESFRSSSSDCRRSDLTTANSLKLYTSFFSPDVTMTSHDLTYMLGQRPGDLDDFNSKPNDGRVDPAPPRTSNFVTRAARVGISIVSHSDILKSKSPPLFQFERRRSIPAGFEMINEDMFARKENKFMVLNGAGVDSWTGTAPVTKIEHKPMKVF